MPLAYVCTAYVRSPRVLCPATAATTEPSASSNQAAAPRGRSCRSWCTPDFRPPKQSSAFRPNRECDKHLSSRTLLCSQLRATLTLLRFIRPRRARAAGTQSHGDERAAALVGARRGAGGRDAAPERPHTAAVRRRGIKSLHRPPDCDTRTLRKLGGWLAVSYDTELHDTHPMPCVVATTSVAVARYASGFDIWPIATAVPKLDCERRTR